jgi:Lon protease-like protein
VADPRLGAVTRRIPLFPLGAVLYPGLVLPLHVFEPRYRALVQGLLDAPPQEPREFGVVAIREGREVGEGGARSLHPIGCTASLREVEAYDDGSFNITTVGAQRFRIVSVDTTAPLWQAEIEHLVEEPGATGDALELLTQAVNRSFARYRAALRGTPEELDELATSGLEEAMLRADDDSAGSAESSLITDPAVLSYAVAAAMILDLPEKQFLLAASTTARRLQEERRLLDRERKLIRLIPSLPAVDLVRTPVNPS